MKTTNSKLRKTVIVIISVIILSISLIILFISPITKYIIEKYDKKYTGREITLDWAYVNPFTGYIHLSNLKIYEEKSDSLFFSANSVSANFSIHKLFSKTIEISEITLDHPMGMIINTKKIVNFNDITERFSPKNKTKTNSHIHFNIYKIKIIDGEFHYQQKASHVNYFIKEVNIESAGKSWDSDTMAIKVSLVSGIGAGDLNGNITINFNNLNYHFNAIVNKFDLKIIEQYLQPLINYGSFRANADANITATGNFKDAEDIVLKGLLALNDFHLGKTLNDDYSSFDKFVLFLNELSPKNHTYLIDSASLCNPYFKYERYDNNLDNVQMMFGKEGANVAALNANPEKFNLIIEIAKYVKVLAKNFFDSDYKINRLAIYNGDFKYNDYTLNELFSIDANPIYALADSINKNNNWVKASFKSGIKPYGNANITVRINPKDSSDFDINYHIANVPATVFNPYLIAYTSFPLNRGTVELKGVWNVRGNIINSTNHILIIDPRLNRKEKNNNDKWIPMRLVMGVTRERANVIDYKIPITGNLKDPTFHLKNVLFHTLENIFVKPATIPYHTEVTETEKQIEKSLSFKWKMKQSDLSDKEIKFINKMADFLKDNTDATISVEPNVYAEKEKESILLYEAKKKYFMMKNKINISSFTEDDSAKVVALSIKDSMFVKYLNKQVQDTLLFTIQDKCAALIGENVVNAKYEQLVKERVKVFGTYFMKNGTDNRVKFKAAQKTIPFDGYSFYKINYDGVFPDYLLNAYRQMNELNDEPPRKKFKRFRDRISGVDK